MAPVRTVGAVATLLSLAVVSYFLCKTTQQKSSRRNKLQRRRTGLVAAIGNTPLIRINSLSDATGCEVYSLSLHFNLAYACIAICLS